MLKKKIKKELSAPLPDKDLQRSLDYARYKELTSKSKATQKDADDLAEEVNKKWWAKNRKRFIK